MRYLNLVTAIALIALFVYSSQWLETYIHTHTGNNAARLGFETNLIYILYIASLNILFFQIKKYKGKVSNTLNNISRTLLMTASILISIAFFSENDGIHENRIFSFLATWISFLAITLSFIPALLNIFTREKKQEKELQPSVQN